MELTLKLVTFSEGAWDEMRKTIFPSWTVGAVYLGFLFGAVWPLGALSWFFDGSWAKRFAALLVLGFYVTVVVAAVKMGGAALPREKYDLKLNRGPNEGEAVLVDKTDTEETKFIVVEQDGKVFKENAPGKTQIRFAYRETFLQAGGGGKPRRITQAYTKAEVIRAGVVTRLPYEGKTVLIEGSDGKYTFHVEGGGELTGKDAEFLSKQFNGKRKGEPSAAQQMLPPGPVAVGEVWEIDAAALLKSAKLPGFTRDRSKEQAKGQLLRAYKKAGRQYGVIRFDIVIPLKKFTDKGKEFEFSAGARMVLSGDVDACIDGTAPDFTMTSTMTMDGNFPLPDRPEWRTTVEARSSGVEQRTGVAK
jgi:hypothetical protein